MRLVLRPAPLAALLGAALLLVACGGDDKKKDDKAGSVILPTTGATIAGASPDASPGTTSTTTAGLPQPKEGAVLERVVAPSIRLDSSVETRGLNARGEMEDPDGKDAVAWYNFSEFPGFGGNAVFSGHVDWFTGELGAFGRMKDLKDGDEIVIKMSDGMEMKYKVTSTKAYKSSDAPVGEITGPTEKDSLTFITCEGTFSAGDYSHRRIVRAERVS